MQLLIRIVLVVLALLLVATVVLGFHLWRLGGPRRKRHRELKRRSKLQEADRERHRIWMQKKQPLFRRDVVERTAKLLFPSGDSIEILKLLDAYSSESAAGTARIQLAALKLSNGNLDQLRYYINQAKQDFRNVVIPAENPELHRLGAVAWERLPESEKESLGKKEIQEYLDFVGS